MHYSSCTCINPAGCTCAWLCHQAVAAWLRIEHAGCALHACARIAAYVLELKLWACQWIKPWRRCRKPFFLAMCKKCPSAAIVRAVDQQEGLFWHPSQNLELACLNFEAMLAELFLISKSLLPKEVQKAMQRFDEHHGHKLVDAEDSSCRSLAKSIAGDSQPHELHQQTSQKHERRVKDARRGEKVD